MVSNLRSAGFVYVMTNPAMPGLVKVGYSNNLSEDRARKLYTSGVPLPFTVNYRTLTSFPQDTEKRAHELLFDKRLDPKREFFEVPADIAEAAIEQARIDVAGIGAWDTDEPVELRADDSFALATKRGQIFVVLSYSPIEFAWKPVDIWQSHCDGDLMHLISRASEKGMASFSEGSRAGSTDPLPFVDRSKDAANWPIIGREHLQIGQRLLWLDFESRSPAVQTALFDMRDFCQILNRSRTPQFSREGFPLLLNILIGDPAPQAIPVIQKILRLAPPRDISLQNTDSNSEVTLEDPSYWLPQLKNPRRRE